MFVAAFHPNNGDLIFFLIDHDIYKYKFGEQEYKKVGKLNRAFNLPRHITEKFTRYLKVITFMYPSWPTPTPPLRLLKS